MGMVKKIISGSALVAVNIIFGRAIMGAINAFGFYPEKILADILVDIAPELISENTVWIFAGLFALFLFWIEVKFQLLERTINIFGKERPGTEKPVNEYMPLSEAARTIYTELRVSGNSVHVTLAEGSNSPEGILNYIAIAIQIETEIFGKHPPSTRLERIDPDEFKRGMICNEGGSFRYYSDSRNRVAYTDLAIKSAEINNVLQSLKDNEAALNQENEQNIEVWIPIIEAVEYIHKHIGMSGTNEVDSGSITLEVMVQIRQAGHEDAIVIRGNKEINRDMPGSNYDNLKTKVRSEYWGNMEIDPVCVDPDAQEEPQTEPSVLSDYNAQTNPKYFHLEIKRQDMLNRWNKSAIKGRGEML